MPEVVLPNHKEFPGNRLMLVVRHSCEGRNASFTDFCAQQSLATLASLKVELGVSAFAYSQMQTIL